MSRRLKWVQYLGLASIGLAANMVGPLLPAIRAEIGMTHSQAGLVLSALFFGVLVTVLVGGHLADRFGKRLYLLAGGLLLIAGLLGSLSARSFAALFSWLVLAGVGYGAYEVGMNALCSDTTESGRGAAINLLHMFFGFGAVAGPVLATICVNAFASWRLALAATAVLPAVVSAMLLGQNLPFAAADRTRASESPYRSGFVWLAGLALFVYVGLEHCFGGWLPTFWKALPGMTTIPAPLTATFFWVTLTFGRLVSGKLADRVGFGKYLMVTSGATVLLAALWLLFPLHRVTLAVALLAGLALAGTFPTVMMAAASRHPRSSGRTVAFMTLFAGLGGFVVPAGVGRAADALGIRALPGIIIGLAAALAAIVVLGWGVRWEGIRPQRIAGEAVRRP